MLFSYLRVNELQEESGDVLGVAHGGALGQVCLQVEAGAAVVRRETQVAAAAAAAQGVGAVAAHAGGSRPAPCTATALDDGAEAAHGPRRLLVHLRSGGAGGRGGAVVRQVREQVHEEHVQRVAQSLLGVQGPLHARLLEAAVVSARKHGGDGVGAGLGARHVALEVGQQLHHQVLGPALGLARLGVLA
jgi:hypothetical protein